MLVLAAVAAVSVGRLGVSRAVVTASVRAIGQLALVSLLIAPAVVAWSIGNDQNTALRVIIAIVAALVIFAAVINSKRKPISMGEDAPASTPAERISA